MYMYLCLDVKVHRQDRLFCFLHYLGLLLQNKYWQMPYFYINSIALLMPGSINLSFRSQLYATVEHCWTQSVLGTNLCAAHYSLIQKIDREMTLIHFWSVAVGVDNSLFTQSLYAVGKWPVLCTVRASCTCVSGRVYLISLSWITLWLWSN